MLDSAAIVNLIFMNKIGEAVLQQTFQDAALFLIRSNNTAKIGNQYSRERASAYKEAYAFVQGTGIEILVKQYFLEYDAGELKSSFFYSMRRNGDLMPQRRYCEYYRD